MDKSNFGRQDKDTRLRILKAIQEGHNTKMKIMHSVVLPDHIATRLLNELVQEQLISREPGASSFKLTAAGKSQIGDSYSE